MQDFLTIADETAAIVWSPIDSPLITLKDIWRGNWYDRLDLDKGMLFAYVMNNCWFTNYKAGQGGELTFRFAMTSAARADDVAAKRFGEAVQVPMLAKLVQGGKRARAASARSLVKVGGAGVVLQAMKPARFTNGTVIRLREMAGKATTATVTPTAIAFRKAYLSNLAEDKVRALPARNGMVAVPCRALGLATVILER